MRIYLTERCNWTCQYCSYCNNSGDVSLENLKEYLPLLLKKEPKEVILYGGEIGLLDEEKIDFIFSSINERKTRVVVETNGTFIKKFDINELNIKYPNIDFVYLYHIAPEITKDMKVEIIPSDIDNIIYTFVIHRKNVDFLEEFLRNNKDVFFSPGIYSDKKYPYNEDLELTLLDRVSILKIFSEVGNAGGFVIDNLQNYLRYSEREKKIIRKVCGIVQGSKEYDLVNLMIRKCCITHSLGVPLTEENIKTDIELEDDGFCKHCNNLYCVRAMFSYVHYNKKFQCYDDYVIPETVEKNPKNNYIYNVLGE